MWFALQPSDLAFVDDESAVRVRVTVSCPAPPARVFDALADAPSWPTWFSDMKRASWTSTSTACLGAVRKVTLSIGTFEERMIAWEPGVRFAFSIDGASLPLAKRIAEDYRLSPDGAGTRLDWAMVIDAPAPVRALSPAVTPLLARMFQRAATGLARHVAP